MLIVEKAKTSILLNDVIKTPTKLYKNLLYLNTLTKVTYYSEFINYQYFNLYYLNNIYKINLKEKNINSIHILPKKIIKYILYKTRYKHYKRFDIKYFNEVIYMFLVCV